MSGIFEDFAHGVEKASEGIKKGSKVNTTNSRIRKGEVAGPAMPKKVARKIAKKQVSRVADKAWTTPKREAEAKKAWNKKVDRESKKIVKKLQAPKVSKQIDTGAGDLIDLLLPKKSHSDLVSSSAGIAPDSNYVRDRARAGKNVVVATIEDPASTLSETAKRVPETVASIPVGLYKIGKTATWDGKPGKAASDLADAYVEDQKRYDESDEQQKKRFKEQGYVPELVSAAGTLSIGGAAVGQTATMLARAGALGKKANRLVAEARPEMRVSGDVAVPQKLSGNFFKAAAQKGVDKQRVRKQLKVEKDYKERGVAKPAMYDAVPAGQVVPIRKKTYEKAQHVDVGKASGRMHRSFKKEKGEEIHRGIEKDIAALSKPEKKAFKQAVEQGIRTPEQARKHLPYRAANIKAARKATGEKPGILRRGNNDLAVIESILKNPEKAFTPRLAETVEKALKVQRRSEEGDPGVLPETAEGRRHAPQAAALGLPDPRFDKEAVAKTLEKVNSSIDRAARRGRISKGRAHALKKQAEESFSQERAIAKVRAKAEERGLAEPGYFKSERFVRDNHASHAGGGRKMIQGVKHYTARAHKVGMEDTRPQVFLDSIAHNIKRKHNWNSIADNVERHSFEWGRNKSAAEIKRYMEDNGIDEGSVQLFAPDRYREKAAEALDDGSADVGGDEMGTANLHEAVGDSKVSLAEVRRNSEKWKKAKLYAVPKAVYDEIHAGTAPSGKVGRSWDIAKQGLSRGMLKYNPVWAASQPVANAIPAAIHGVGPVTFVKAQREFHKMPKAQRDAIEPFLGDSQFQMDVAHTRLGAASDSKLVDAYHGFQKSKAFLWKERHITPKANALLRFDNAQNNMFRRAVFVKGLDRQVQKRIERSAHGIMGKMDRLMGKNKKELRQQILDDPKAVEEIAAEVDRAMGDYTGFTARERKVFARYSMFYPFLRYSLKFTFRTMPADHPIISSIGMKLGQLQAEDTKEILGLDKGETLPASAAGKLFNEDGTESVNLGRINPAMNSLMSLQNRNQIVGATSPVAQVINDYINNKSSFKGTPHSFDGMSPFAAMMSGESPDAEASARIGAKQLLSTLAPYRVADKIVNPGPQGDDSLLFDPRPTSSKSSAGEVAKQVAHEKGKGVPRRLMEQLIPFLPQEDHTKDFLASKGGKKKLKKKSGGSVPVVKVPTVKVPVVKIPTVN